MPDQRPQRRKYQWQGNHHGDQPGRHKQLDNHDTVECAGKQGQDHADADLEQRKTQKTAQRQGLARNICEWQNFATCPLPGVREFASRLRHGDTFMAWEI